MTACATQPTKLDSGCHSGSNKALPPAWRGFWCCAGQVEHQRLDIPRATPLAVQQWEGLIAINYAARAAGITRHMRVGEALKICPDLQAVHVQTLGKWLRLSPLASCSA